MSSCRFLVVNSVVSPSPEVPQVSSFLETHPGAYTTTRTHSGGSCVLFWDRHLRRLAESARILAESRADLMFGVERSGSRVSPSWPSLLSSVLGDRVGDSLREGLSVSLEKRSGEEELAITTLVNGTLDVYVHIGFYVPPVFGGGENGARLAVVGRGRDVARAKYSEWVSMRKSLERMRPPLVNELLLSHDGDCLLEGCLTNFFVVCRKEKCDAPRERQFDTISRYHFEVQTAPLSDGVLPGVIRQLVIEVCLTTGIPFREVTPQWSQRELWQEAFITNGLRLVQHVETIQVPSPWEPSELKTWKDVNWEKKCFEDAPGLLTREIQREIMKRTTPEAKSVRELLVKRTAP